MKPCNDYPISFAYKAQDGLLVDDEDKHLLTTYGRWIEIGKVGYAQICWKENGKRLRKYLHRVIMNAPPNMVVDHINRNKLDNRKSNLRLLTRRENLINCKVNSKNSTGTTCVQWYKSRNKYMVQVGSHGKKIFMGYFDDLDDAQQCAYAARHQLNDGIIGEFTR